jgi:hypothetical protein
MRSRPNQWAIALLSILITLGTGCSKAPSDAQLSQQIQAKFSEDSGLQGKTLSVQVSAGVVTLSGRLENDAERTAASRYAAAITGVKQVVNNIEVGPVPAAPAQIATAAAAPPPTSKPRPGIPRNTEKPASSGRDPSEWDSPGSSASNSANNAEPPATQEAENNAPPISAAPAAEPAPPPVPKMLTIPSDSKITIRLVDAISSETAQMGQTFRATLDSPLSSSKGEVAVASGYTVEGHVVDVKSAGKFAGQSLLVLALDRLRAGGKTYSLDASQFRRQGSNRSTNTAEKVGGGAAVGAILGGIFGGGRGAGIGAAAGGGLGGGVQAAGKGQQIRLESETVLIFTLESPLTVTQADKSPEAGRPKLDSPQ